MDKAFISLHQKLSFKIIGIIILFSLALFVFLAADNIYSRKKDIMPLFVERAKATAYSIEASIRNEQELRDKSRLLSLIQKNMWLDSDIVDININIKQGDDLLTYVSNNPEKINQISDDDNLNSFNNDIFINKNFQNKTAENMKVVAPIHLSGKLVGTIQIDFDLSDINNTISQAIRGEVLGYSVIFLVFILVMFFIFKLIVIKPIVDISNGVNAIKGLNFDYKIKVKSKDEIGNLAEAFNTMAGDLKNSRLELENYNTKLKQQVEEQTKDLEAAKNKLETINLDLEQKVKVRTAELENLQANQEELIKRRTMELNQKVDELEKLNKFMINRENKMIELKKEIEELKRGQ